MYRCFIEVYSDLEDVDCLKLLDHAHTLKVFKNLPCCKLSSRLVDYKASSKATGKKNGINQSLHGTQKANVKADQLVWIKSAISREINAA